MNEKIASAFGRGYGRGYYVTPGGHTYFSERRSSVVVPGQWEPKTGWHHNDILYTWAGLVQRALRNVKDGTPYYINGAYIEFDNSGDPVDPLPTVSREDGLSYYNSLPGTRDFLRVPITATSELSTDEDLYPDGNVATFFVQTAGTLGFSQGLTFSDAANSIVYGIALVAIREQGDSSRDIIFNRLYLPTTEQLPKLLGKQISMQVRLQFE